MRRKNRVDIYAEAPSRGNYDECPMIDIGHEPQLHLSKNDVVQPFFLICESDCVIAQLAGTARVEFRNSSVNYFDLGFGDFVYVPGGTPHRLIPKTTSIHVRYKAEFAGLEACAWYSPATGKEIARIAWDCAVELPQEGYLRACTAFNHDRVLRTCTATGEELPPIDISLFNWAKVAKSVREAEEFERARLAKRGVSIPQPEWRADLTFRPPATHTEPMRVNIYEFVRVSTCQLNPMFPYLGPGCIVPCSAMHDPLSKGAMGYFIHENTVDEVNLCFGAHSNFRMPGAVFVGPMIHGVGEKPDPRGFSGEKHGVGEKKGSEDLSDMYAVMVITQRQAVGIPQREAWSIVCEKCETELCRHPYDAHAYPDRIEVDNPALLGLPTISQDAWIVERINEDVSLRTCKKCGHVNPKFPITYWGWADYRRRTHVAVRCRDIMAEAAAKALHPAPAVAEQPTAISRESFGSMAMEQVEFHRVASIGEIEDGCASEVTIGDNVIAVFRLGDDYYAIAGICTHAYARLAEGYVEGDVIECPYHGGTYDIRTGKALTTPCTVDLKQYPVRIDGDAILVGIGAEDA